MLATAATPWTVDPAHADPARHLMFYVGFHHGRALERSSVPLFVSYRTLAKYQRHGDPFPKARCLYSLDSGGFTELSTFGDWTIDPDEYGGAVYRFMEDCGRPVFASPQDWMCEPWIVAKTGLSVRTHQQLTIENFVYLRENFPHAPWIPVLQGWSLDEYLQHAADYAAAGIDLATERLVGLGSVCRRQSTAEIGAITDTFKARGYRLHGFGVKAEGLEQYGHNLASADSLAWSFGARRRGIRLPDCKHPGDCRNCLRYATHWRESVVASLRTSKQYALDLF